jgi:hypothetical protein
MELGIITGSEIKKNRDGDKDKILLQVQVLDEDTRTVEMIGNHGEDIHPARNCRIIIIRIGGSEYSLGITDDLEPEVVAGEKEIYSTDDPVTVKKARMKFGADSVITINQGVNFAAKYNELKTAYEELQSKFNNHVHPGVTAGVASTGATATPSTGDITLSKCDKVKLP